MNTEQFLNRFANLEPKAIIFNKDRQHVDRLLNSLLINKKLWL